MIDWMAWRTFGFSKLVIHRYGNLLLLLLLIIIIIKTL